MLYLRRLSWINCGKHKVPAKNGYAADNCIDVFRLFWGAVPHFGSAYRKTGRAVNKENCVV